MKNLYTINIKIYWNIIMYQNILVVFDEDGFVVVLMFFPVSYIDKKWNL